MENGLRNREKENLTRGNTEPERRKKFQVQPSEEKKR
jgi:hypothetical protein